MATMSGMRSFAKSKVALAIFGILIVAFGFGVGMRDPFSGITGGGFVSAGDRKIGVRDVNRMLNREIEAQRTQNNKIISLKEAAQQGMTAAIVNEMIQQTVTLAYADKIGVKASPKAVSDFLVTNAPRFKDALGRINSQAVAQFAAEQGMTEKEFEEQLRDNLTFDYIDRSMFAGAAAPKVLSQPLLTFLGERRTFSMARLTPEAAPKPAEPTEDQLKAFYTEHAANFAEPERRSISVVSYSPADFTDKVAVPDTQVKSEYDRRIKEFSAPETRVIQQVTAKDRAGVQNVVDLVKQGGTIEDAVKKTDGAKVVTLTVKPADLADKNYSDGVFAAPLNEIEGPYQIKEIWLAFKVTSATAGAAKPFADVADQLRTEIADKEARRLFSASAENFNDLVGGGSSLEEISTGIGAPVIELSGVDKSGTHPTLGKINLLTSHPDALKHMFEAKVGEVSEVVEGDNERAVMRLDAITPRRTPPLEEIRAKVHDLWMVDAQRKAAQGVMENFVAAMKTPGKDWDTAAAAAKLNKGHFPNVNRGGMQGQTTVVDPTVLEAAFNLSLNETKLLTDSNGEPWAVRVDAIIPFDAAKDGGLVTQVDNIVKQGLVRDLSEVFGRGVQKEVNVTVNQKAIQDYLDGFTKDEAQ